MHLRRAGRFSLRVVVDVPVLGQWLGTAPQTPNTAGIPAVDVVATNGKPTYFVRKTGNDGNDGSDAYPWLTIDHAFR